MASFLYVGDDERVYPNLHKIDGSTLVVTPGDVVEADANPDSRRFDPVNGDSQVPHPPAPSAQ